MLRAANDFTSRVAAVRQLLAVDQSYDDAAGVTPSDKIPLVFFLRTSVAVLSVSLFEDFLRTLLEGFINELNSRTPRISWNFLPQKLRQAHVFDTPITISKRIPPGENYDTYESSYLSELKVTFANILSPLTTPNTYLIAPEGFTETNDNPISGTVTSLFSRIGISDVFAHPDFLHAWQTVDPRYTTREVVIRELDSIVILRHSFAHGRKMDPALGLTVTRGDLDTRITFLERLAKNLEEVLVGFLNQLSSDPTLFNGTLKLNWINERSFVVSVALPSGREAGANLLSLDDCKQLFTLLGEDENKVDALDYTTRSLSLPLTNRPVRHLHQYNLLKPISDRNSEIAGKRCLQSELIHQAGQRGIELNADLAWKDNPTQSELSFRGKRKRKTHQLSFSLTQLISTGKGASADSVLKARVTSALSVL